MTPLEQLASRVADDPTFFASALKEFSHSEGVTDAILAERLGCSAEVLAPVRLCRMPRPGLFVEDVERIAARFSLNADALVDVARRGQVLLQMRGSSPAPGALLAARDRRKSPQSGQEDSE